MPLIILLWSTVIENQCISSAVVAILFLIYIGSNYIQEYILPIGFIKLWSEVSEIVVYRRLKLVEVADQKVVFSF